MSNLINKTAKQISASKKKLHSIFKNILMKLLLLNMAAVHVR